MQPNGAFLVYIHMSAMQVGLLKSGKIRKGESKPLHEYICVSDSRRFKMCMCTFIGIARYPGSFILVDGNKPKYFLCS